MAQTLLNVVATFHSAKTTWIFTKSVFTTQRRTPAWAVILHTFFATTKKVLYINQRNNPQTAALRLSTIVFYFHLFMNHILILFFTLQTTIPATKKPTPKMCVLIQSNLQFGHESMVLHTWATRSLASLLIKSMSLPSTMKLINGLTFPGRRSID